MIEPESHEFKSVVVVFCSLDERDAVANQKCAIVAPANLKALGLEGFRPCQPNLTETVLAVSKALNALVAGLPPELNRRADVFKFPQSSLDVQREKVFLIDTIR